MAKVPLDQGSFCQGSFGPRFLWTEVPLVKVPLGQGSFAKVPLDQVPLVKVPLGLHLLRYLVKGEHKSLFKRALFCPFGLETERNFMIFIICYSC